LWEAVYHLENIGCLAANRRLFSLHKPGSTTPVHKVLNPHAHDGEKCYLWFLSDPLHLMKTVRNSWANCKWKLCVSMGSSDGTVQKQQVTDRGHRIVTGAKTEVRTCIPNQLFEDASGPM